MPHRTDKIPTVVMAGTLLGKWAAATAAFAGLALGMAGINAARTAFWRRFYRNRPEPDIQGGRFAAGAVYVQRRAMTGATNDWILRAFLVLAGLCAVASLVLTAMWLVT